MSFQTLHDHMIITGTRGYKTGTFITKNFFFKFVYSFEYKLVYICIYMMFLSQVAVIGS